MPVDQRTLPPPVQSRRQPRKRGIALKTIHWPVAIGITLMHAGCLLAPFYFSWTALAMVVFLYWFTGGIGITLCYHRLLTHRSFTTPRWFEYVLSAIGCLAWQGGPIQWVGTHRIHHKHSDTDDDPHTPRHGFGWAHMFWCMHREPRGLRAVDAAKDLQRSRGMRFIDRFFWVPQVALLPLLFAGGEVALWLGLDGGAVSWLLWGVCVRTVLVYHGTWFVNSASHTWGYRNYRTTDGSTNCWWVALISFGEGWHNNHHAHQNSAAHGLRWFEIDLTYLTIRLLACVGLASDIILPASDQRP